MTIGLARGARDTRAPNNFQTNKSNMAAATSLKVAIHVRVTVDSLVRETVERTFLRDSTWE